MSATFLRNRIIGALRSSPDADISKSAARVTQNVIFSFSTIKTLTTHITSLIENVNVADIDHVSTAKDAIEKMIEKYSGGLGNVPISTGEALSTAVVLLTGSSGGLGSHLLESLLKDDMVQRIYAYNRPSRGPLGIRARQIEAFEDRGLDTSFLASDKLVFVEGDSGLPNLGLNDDLLQEVRSFLLAQPCIF